MNRTCSLALVLALTAVALSVPMIVILEGLSK